MTEYPVLSAGNVTGLVDSRFVPYPPTAPVDGRIDPAALPAIVSGSQEAAESLRCDLERIEGIIGPGRTVWRLAWRRGSWEREFSWPRHVFVDGEFEVAMADLVAALNLPDVSDFICDARAVVAPLGSWLPGGGRGRVLVTLDGPGAMNSFCRVEIGPSGSAIAEVLSHFATEDQIETMARWLAENFGRDALVPPWLVDSTTVTIGRTASTTTVYSTGVRVSDAVSLLEGRDWPTEGIAELRTHQGMLEHLRLDVSFGVRTVGQLHPDGCSIYGVVNFTG